MPIRVIYDLRYCFNEIQYICHISDVDFNQVNKCKLKGNHIISKFNADVTMLAFSECKFYKIPNLTKIFKNLKILQIMDSNLKKLSKDDLECYKNLEMIHISFCDLTFLPGNLFNGFEKLQKILFYNNKLEIIQPNILDGLEDLAVADFQDNTNYDDKFDRNEMELSEFRSALVEKYINAQTDDAACYIRNLHAENQELTEKCEQLNNFLETISRNPEVHEEMMTAIVSKDSQIADLEDQIQKLQEEVKSLLKYKSSVYLDLELFMLDDTTKDFKIKIGSKEFLAHKFLLAARCPSFSQILDKNIKSLTIADISAEIFEEILNFLYTDELPSDGGTNFLDLFVAAGKLKIKELKNYAAEKLFNQIDGNNALEILKLSIKYEHEELTKKAFDEFKKNYPGVEFKDKVLKSIDDLDKFIEIIKRKDEADRLMKEFLEV